MSARRDTLEVAAPCSGEGWSFDVAEELQDLRDQVASLEAQLAGQGLPPDRAGVLVKRVGERTRQREEALELVRATASMLIRSGRGREGLELHGRANELRARWREQVQALGGRR